MSSNKAPDSKQKKALTIATYVLVIILFLYVILYPILQFTTLGTKSHQGVELFAEKAYLEYDSGEAFDAVVEELSFIAENEVRNFAYHDSCRQDHLLWGKFPDLYILEVYVGENFDQICTQYWDENAVYHEEYTHAIKLHSVEKVGWKYNQLYLAFSEIHQSVRILYRTGLPLVDKERVNGLIVRWCEDWNEDREWYETHREQPWWSKLETEDNASIPPKQAQ